MTEPDWLGESRLKALRMLRALDGLSDGVRCEASAQGLVLREKPDAWEAKVLTEFGRALEPLLPGGIVLREGVAFVLGDGVERIPDLAVLDPVARAELRAGEAESTSGVWMFVEVTSGRARRVDLIEKSAEYARAEVPVMLVVDRETHEVVVRFEPVDGRYTYTGRIRAGTPVRLPAPFEVTVDTGFMLDHL
ncbi:Uma2 family endonuclease [Embleya sp. NBC_00896]|uniref:Uma2 family endonuclease n=1 Tax=Embleya sp. NBC_00896 TaxID=2975961 RepID=UPI003866BAE1|nr:Uma2 family endonuclease [Embleya sp. NBC_00896]